MFRNRYLGIDDGRGEWSPPPDDADELDLVPRADAAAHLPGPPVAPGAGATPATGGTSDELGSSVSAQTRRRTKPTTISKERAGTESPPSVPTTEPKTTSYNLQSDTPVAFGTRSARAASNPSDSPPRGPPGRLTSPKLAVVSDGVVLYNYI